MPYILGVTGGIGSGKSAATEVFESLGIDVVDADKVAREVVTQGSPALHQISLHFGDNILLASGELDRSALRASIFSDAKEKQWLEELLHPLIRTLITERLRRITSSYGILSSPLLFESGQDSLVERTLLIDCPEDIQLHRATQRDDIDVAQIKAIMATQRSREQRKRKADNVIDNVGGLEDLAREINDYHLKLLNELC
ncbi:MAG: dephospho-CoA kinase [Kiritimatiellia bacterium]|jgi:dephospho-CoA kinase